MSEKKTKGEKGRGGSFCVPRAAIDVLIRQKASALEICAYLCLARFTDETGAFSTARYSAIRRYTGSNMAKGGAIDKAMQKLINRVSDIPFPGQEQGHCMPLVYQRADWEDWAGVPVKDVDSPRGRCSYVLETFGEDLSERVWFGNNLVSGVESFDAPLCALKNAGDMAARLLLVLYANNNMPQWGGVDPFLSGSPFVAYELREKGDKCRGGFSLSRWDRSTTVGVVGEIFERNAKAYFAALDALTSAGFVYEVVIAFNRDPEIRELKDGEKYLHPAMGCEPLYELDARSRHGYKPKGEQGLAWATAKTAGELGRPVADARGEFSDTYAAIVPDGFGITVAGIYRLRFRVTNRKSAGVVDTWTGIADRYKSGLQLVNRLRTANKLEPLEDPYQAQRDQDEDRGEDARQTPPPASAPFGTLVMDGDFIDIV